jgi:hypothetical protein
MQFLKYKTNPAYDITNYFFEPPCNIPIEYSSNIDFHWEFQFEPYNTIKFNKLTPFIKKYFEPSLLVKQLLLDFETKNDIDYQKIIGVHYRGNDKHTETQVASHDSFIFKCEDVLKNNPNSRFFLLTDELEFKDKFLAKFDNTFFNDLLPFISFTKSKGVDDTLDRENKTNFAANFLSSILALSKCKNVITHSGNGALWTALYRNNTTNFNQYLKHKTNDLDWVIS